MAATYTVKQVAEILGYSTNSIYTFLKEKRIKGVRVGTGRFRIPQSELDRLLLITKRQSAATSAPAAASPIAPNVGVMDVVGGTRIEKTNIFGLIHLGTLNIFDWFVGIAALISGFSLFIFNPSLQQLGLTASSATLNVIRIIYVGGGAGIILTNIAGQTHTAWHKIFHVLVGLLSLGFGIIWWRGGQIDGSLAYGIFGILVLLSTFIHMGGALWVSIYMSALTLAAIVSIVLSPWNAYLSETLTRIPISEGVILAMVIFISILFITALWVGYNKNRQVFLITTWVAALSYFGVAFWYGAGDYWVRSFFFLVVGMTSLFLSPWEALASIRSRRADMFTLGVFGLMFMVLIGGITGVYLMQSNTITTEQQENTNKVVYAKTSLEATVQSVLATTEQMAADPEFTAAVAKKDLATVNTMERVTFGINTAIRRFVILDQDGQGFNLYPYGTFDQTDLSSRDYFIQARATGQPYVSDLFQALADQSKQLVVAVAVPMYGDNHQFIGVLVSSLDLEAIGARLQKIAVPSRGEYIDVVDSNGKHIINPESSMIGTAVDKDDAIFYGIHGGSGTLLGTTYTGDPAIVTYDTVHVDDQNWSIAIVAPTAKLYDLTDESDISIFSIIVAAIIIAGFVLSGGFFWRQRRGGRGGSP